MPSKTLSYLCAGRALLVAAPAQNEAARVVQRAGAGLVVSPDDPAEFIAAAERLLANRELCAQLGTNGRRYAEENFSIRKTADRFLAVMAPEVAPVTVSPLDDHTAELAAGKATRW